MDRILFRWELPWPDFVVAAVKSGQKGRWTLFFRLLTEERTLPIEDSEWGREFRHIWFLQLRAWWFPVFFYKGWMEMGVK